ncbi:MAG TPA: DUF1059 domain-containing protein [Acidimicrobiia bacterium]|jgi:predicted small metal-binding protein|nr:DUF1059 domain-containing protein [Acidimicrobiia bacterium]
MVQTYEYVCSNVYPECDVKIEGESEEEVLETIADHMREHHAVIELPPDVTRWVLNSVRPDD